MKFKNIIIGSLILMAVFSLAVAIPSEIRAEASRSGKTARPFLRGLMGKGAKLINAWVTAINGQVITVTQNGKTYTVNTDATTRFRRLFWGKSTLSEISAGDNINVWGSWADEAQTTINAKMIRDTSIMKRFGVFLGNIKSKDTASFVVTTLKRGDQTVIFDSNTKFINRKGSAMNYSDINVGDKVKVRGLWDKNLNKITEVSQVKDFSNPPKPALTPGK